LLHEKCAFGVGASVFSRADIGLGIGDTLTCFRLFRNTNPSIEDDYRAEIAGGNLVSPPEPPAAPADPYAACCPTRLLLDRIGDKWMVLTLSLIRDKPRRFNALRRDIEGVTQKMLSQTLKQMERDGPVIRTVLPTMPVSVEYAITPLGQTLAALLDGLQLWARDHLAAQRHAATTPWVFRFHNNYYANQASA
jgi:DNA-binding HxlR family transcriptional regulator